jgi:hypothetical protein
MSISMSEATAESEWLLLLFFLPARRAPARVQAWRRLQRIGAVSLKNSVYALPHSADTREDFEWIRKEIVSSGGQAMVLVARAPDAATLDDIVEAFRSARRGDYQALATAASGILAKLPKKGILSGDRDLTQQLRRLRERFDETARRDFFAAPEREQVEALLARLDHRAGRRQIMAAANTSPATRDYRGKVWLTRPRPGVDRMSSAWLIRRFIDRTATFVFTEPARTPDAISFDTFQAEFGHHGTHCTFETLCERFAINDPAVQHIGRIVHDLDLKDTRYDEAETSTIGQLVEGLRRAHQDDDALLRSGMEMFEALYQSLTAATVIPAATRAASRRRPRGSRELHRRRRR